MTFKLAPSSDQLAQLMAPPADKPLAVLNIFKFHAVAQYQPDDPEYGTPAAEISGAEAYKIYGTEAGEKIYALGGRLHMSALVDQIAIGPADKDWELAAILIFPTRHAFLDMMADPDFQHASRHRKAALNDHYMIHLAG